MYGQVAAPKASKAAEALVAEAPSPRARRTGLLGRVPTPYWLLAPAAVFLAVFFVWPMIQALILAFQAEDGSLTSAHFQRMVNDTYFWPAVKYTLLLIVCIVPLQMVLALAMSLLLQTGLRGTSLFLYAWSIPLAISDLAAGIVWLAIFTDRGYLNSILASLGLSETGFPFLSYEHPVSLFLAVVVAETWRATSLVMVILVAGVQVIPKDYGEAAEVFGATFWQRLRYVTLPLLRPSLQVALILRTILAFQVFAVVIALAGRNLPVLVGEAYYWYGSYSNPNVAAAYALLILVFSLLNTGIYLRALRVRDEQVGL